MSKKAPETIAMDPSEIKLIDMDFSNDLGSLDVGAISSITITPGAQLTESGRSFSGKRAQALYDATGAVDGTTYEVEIVVTDTGSPTQTFKGRGEILVQS